MKKDRDVVFTCRKCDHKIFVENVSTEKLQGLIDMECPNCGEEGYENWFLLRMGNYDKEYGSK